MTTAELFRLDKVTCAYNGAPVLVDIDLTIRVAAFIGIVGPSGSGKTTLLRVLTGALKPSSGRVHKRGRVTVGYVPQVETVNWFFPVTVREAVLMARASDRRLPWASKAELRDVDGVLERLGLAGLAERHIRELSGGQQQRVFIARAMLKRADLLLMDEPTSGVDVRTRHDVVHLLHELHHDGLAIVVTTHDLNGIAAHLPELVCLNREVVATGEPRHVLTPEVLERTYGAPMEVLSHGGMPVVVEVATPPSDVLPSRGEHHEHD
jgi:ABC-type Mn2+/Zn2+ transport system ATPase subunit